MMKKTIISKLIDSLAKDGERILAECEKERTYQHQTKNLYDSYGYGVYVHGKLEKSGFLSASPLASKAKVFDGEKIKGREEIEEFLRSGYSPQGGIDLVIAAAMPYGKILEEGSGRLHHKYKVISMAHDKLKRIAGKYGGNVSILRP